MTVSGAIIEWLKEFDPTEYWKMNKINTDVMHGDVDYALVKEPIRNVKNFISGTQIITEHYQLRARLDSINDNDSVDNGAWLEALTNWIDKRNQEKVYPEVESGAVQEIGISSPFYMGRSEDKKAIYQLTIFIRIRKESTTYLRDPPRQERDVSMGKEASQYELLGDGITSLTENMNPEEETKHYINMSKASNKVKSYQRTFDVDKEDCIDDEVQKWIDKLVDDLPTGASANTSFVRLRLKDTVTGSAGTYKAIKVPCTVSVASSGGDGGDYTHNVINVKQCGEDIKGTFDVKTKTFTPNAAETNN